MTSIATTSAPMIELVPLDQLHPEPANPRRISEEELDALERSLREFGFVQPVLARRDDRTVIGGHQRLVAARRLGLTEVPVTWLDISVQQARLLGLALNKISGSFDDVLLARLLAELQATGTADISLSGFGEDEVRDLLRSLDAREKRDRPESFDLDAALEAATRQPRSKPGDVWALGDHRVGCGDATVPADVDRLLAGRRPAMAFTDPPYNVSLGDHGGQARGARRRRMSILAEAGGRWSDTVIWAKDRFVLGRADYQRAYEPIWYGWREGMTHHWWFQLVVRINTVTHELLDRQLLLEGLLSARLELLTNEGRDKRQRDAAYLERFRQLRDLITIQLTELEAHQAACHSVEERYLAGDRALFPDDQAAWVEQAKASERIGQLAVALAEKDGLPMPERPDPDAVAARVAQLAVDLVEPARVVALEQLGEGRRAFGIATSWVRGKLAPTSSDPARAAWLPARNARSAD